MALFSPQDYRVAEPATATFGERGGGEIYVWNDKTVFAVQVAQVTGRPLLIRGPAGSGKSSLAPFVANVLRLPFYLVTVTARTRARDMMWEYDALGRLNDANVSSVDEAARRRVRVTFNYVQPRALWWAFDRTSAAQRGAPEGTELETETAIDPSAGTGKGAVVLIDEIDKADPDVPNNLLEALGSRSFTVDETGTTVVDLQHPLVLITTNEERQLPRAFLRRCIVLHLAAKTVDDLVLIAAQHFGATNDDNIYREMAATLVALRGDALRRGTRAPSTAEYLDALAAYRALGVQYPGTDASQSKHFWDYLIEVALSKRRAHGDDDPEVHEPAVV